MKKIIVLALTVVLVFSIAATSYAAYPMLSAGNVAYNNGYAGYGGFGMWTMQGWMCDENGGFLDKEAFEARLDAAVEAGEITAEDKEDLLEMYEWCVENRGIIGRRGFGRGGCCMGRIY